MSFKRIIPFTLTLMLLIVLAQNAGASHAFASGKPGSNVPSPASITSAVQDRAVELIGTEESAAASDGTYLYVIGGYNAYRINFQIRYRYVNYLQRYDPTTDSWLRLANVPVTSIVEATACYMNGHIYVAGGSVGNSLDGTIRIYDIAAGTWSNGASYPGGGYSQANAVCDAASNRVFVLGGSTADVTTTSANRVYNATTNAWQADAAPAPVARSFAAAGLLAGGRIVFASGYDAVTGASDIVSIYTIATNSWAIASSIPSPANAGGYGVGPDGRFYVVGGYSSDFLLGIQVYDPTSNRWVVNTSLNHAVDLVGSGFVGSKFYVVGGLGANLNTNCVGSGELDTICNYNQVLDTSL
jgi:Kelch motif protein